MIKPSDLKIRLEPFKHKRIGDLYGMSLYISGGKKGTTYIFQQRLRINGKYKYITLDTKDLIEARRLALNNFNNKDNYLPIQERITLRRAINELYDYVNKSSIQPNTLLKFNKVYRKHFSKVDDIYLDELTPRYLFNAFIKPSLDKGYYDMVSYIQTKLYQMIELARVNYPYMNIPDIHCMRRLYTMPTEENHLPALSCDELYKLAETRTNSLPIKCLLELSVHLLLRPCEMVNIKLSDIDFDNYILNVPKTKTTTNFKVPLSKQAMIIILLTKQLKFMKNNDYLFEGVSNEHMSSETLNHLLIRNGFKGIQTSHSIRAIGRTWFEKNNIRYEIAETCLSHKVGDSTYRAYVRTDYLEERREVMQKWSNYVSSQFKDKSVILYFLN